jgi:hypothetical protein
MQIQWLDYIYTNSKLKLLDVIRSYNMPIPSDLDECYTCVEILIDQYGEEAEEKLLKCFPEYQGISKLARKESSSRNNAYHNFSGENQVEEKLSKIESKIENESYQSQLEGIKRNQTLLLVAVGILLFAKIKN